MNHDLQNSINKYVNERNSKKKWCKLLTFLCVTVAFVTSYSLINPATTQEQKSYCGLEEHTEHTDDCYEKILLCNLPEEGHIHSDSCYEKLPVLSCGFSEEAEAERHVHSAECYEERLLLHCGLAETEGHIHTEDCFEEQLVLRCELPETDGHIHSADCYEERPVLHCDLIETDGHTHTEACFEEQQHLSCTLEETDGHAHTDACLGTEKYLSCTLEETEGHIHTDACREIERTLICECTEEGHEHSDECYAENSVIICGLEEREPHHHDDHCYSERQIYVCGMEETPAHHHDEKCYTAERVCICGLKECEPHHHDENCYAAEQVLVCGSEEIPAHHHDKNCYTAENVCICGQEVCEPHHHDENCYVTEPVPVCGFEAASVHVHDESCYTLELVCTCGIEACEPHQHSEGCYEINYDHLVCELPIHEHTLQCFSDPEADLETAEVWERSFSDTKLTGKWSDDVLAIAQTQLGYEESTLNYRVLEDGTTMQGYTRYGEWYGYPYDDWCAMFCAFCLHYAGVDTELMPLWVSCQGWINKLNEPEYDLYRNAETYIPAPGDLVFFDWDEFDEDHPEDRHSDHIGFVKALVYDPDSRELTGFTTIEGNAGNQVCVNSYDIDTAEIMGYGMLPRNPEWFTMGAVTETGIQVTVEGLNASLPYSTEEIALSAKEIVNEESAALLAERMEADGKLDMDSILMDISLLHEDEIVEPVGPVYLSFAAKDVDLDSTVYHIDEENETVTEMAAEVNEIESTVSLETEHFSTYALTLNSKSGKNVTAEVEAVWNDTNNNLSSVILKTTSTANNMYHNYDVFNGSSWTIGAGDWKGKTNANSQQTFDITDLVNSSALSTRFRARVAENTGAPENDKSGYSEEFSLYDILEAEKPGFSDWVEDAYNEFFGGTRPTNAAQLFAAFDLYHDLPSLTLESAFAEGVLTVTASTNAEFTPVYVWQYYDDTIADWSDLPGAAGETLNATNYSKLTPEAQPLLDGGKTVRCLLMEGDAVKAAAVIHNVNPLKEVYDAAIITINTGLGLNAYPWYLNGAVKTANVEIGSKAFTDYFYYDNVARDPDVPFFDGESYANYLASEYIRVKDESGADAALTHVAEIWDKYIFDIFNPNPVAGVVGNYKYYPGANGDGPVSTYGDKIIEWPKDGASSFHNPTTGVERNGENGLINQLAYEFLEDGVDYSRFIQSLDKTATADAAGDFNENRSYDIDITAKTQATSVSPLAMLITVQTSWQMFDYAHANCVAGDGTYTSIEVGGAQYNTEMANLYDIKQAILRFVDWMDENFPGHNLVLGINEIQHGGSYNLISYNFGNNNTVYVSNNSELLHQAIYDWDTFGNCEHVHYEKNTTAMENAAAALEANLTGWVDAKGKPIQFDDINKIAVIIGGGTENTNGTNGYGCVVPWGTFYSSDIDSVYGIRTNVGTPLNPDGVLSWLDYYKNNSGTPYSRDPAAGYSSGTAAGSFTAKYVAPNEDAVFNYLVKIAQQELKSKGIKDEDGSKNIDHVTISDTVNDEFMIEKSTAENPKPFVASVYDKNGHELYKTIINPISYNEDGSIAEASVTFTDYITPGAVPQTETVQAVSTPDGAGEISITVNIPYSYIPEGGEALPQSGTVSCTQKLTVKENTDHTTDVSFDFGTVYNTNDAKLHFEVIARDDYIGSNNVFTNEGTPEISFRHVKMNRDGQRVDENGVVLSADQPSVMVENHVESYDTPEVNVPIRFTAEDGGSIRVEVKTPVNLEDLSTTAGGTESTLPESYTGTETDIADSEYITAAVHDLIDNYDQINGTVSYTWVIPGGKEYPVPVTLHVTDGNPDGEITAASEMAQQWIPKTAGIYDVVLKVSFTPDPVEDKGNFADDGGVTATRVTKLEQEGHETIIVNNKEGGDGETNTILTVSKVWSGEKGSTAHRPGSITFNVFQDGEFYDQKTVGASDNWSWTFTDLPYRDPDKPSHIYTYTVTEDKVQNYQTTYEALQTVYHLPYWEEVPLSELDLSGETEYLIVRKDAGVAINPDADEKTISVDIVRKPRPDEFVTPPAGLPEATQSFFADSNYKGWFIKYTAEGNEASNSYLKSAENGKYLKKDKNLSDDPVKDSKLAIDPSAGKLKLNDKFLLMNANGTIGNDGDANKATTFVFYKKYNTANGTYWAEVTDLDLTGGTEYMIVDKASGRAVTLADSSATSAVVTDLSGVLKKKTDEAVLDFPMELDEDAVSYIPDNGYQGWHIFLPDTPARSTSYIESASEDTDLYIKLDGAFVENPALDKNDTLLNEISSSGTIQISDKYLKLKYENNAWKLDKSDNAGGADSFAFYKKVNSTAPPTYRSTVTNTYIPGGERQNETSITVKKDWVNIEANAELPEITIHLLRNGKEIDSCTLDGVVDVSEEIPWTHTFDTYPGTTAKLPYFDPLTGEPYVYTVEEDVVKGYETGYTKTLVHDAKGGLHYLLYNETGSESGLFEDTAYILTTPFALTNGGTSVQQIVGYSAGSFTYTPADIRSETVAYGSLTATRELIGPVDSEYVWTIEKVSHPKDPTDTSTFYLRRNGYYVGVHDDGSVRFSSAPNENKIGYYWKFDTAANKFYAIKGKNYDQFKYLRVSPEYEKKDPKALKAIKYATGDANAASVFTVFEAVSLQSGFDTYAYEVDNIYTGIASADGWVDYAKYIDYLADNIEDSDTANPDTSLCGDYYRLYLDAVGVRQEDSEEYPEFKGVYITDHLSQYVTIADNGSNLALTVNKVSVSNPNEITYLWYGNLNPATGSIGSALADGKSVIRSVVYTRAEEDEIGSTGMIRVDFEPDYCLEEGYKYVLSYNVEATELARSENDYGTTVGDPDTDYPNNNTSSGMPGYKANNFADIVYTQEGEVKIGIYDHPVIQIISSPEIYGYELPETGGIGTEIFCLPGGLLFIGTGILLIRKRIRDSFSQ